LSPPLFPYTTLFRSDIGRAGRAARLQEHGAAGRTDDRHAGPGAGGAFLGLWPRLRSPAGGGGAAEGPGRPLAPAFAAAAHLPAEDRKSTRLNSSHVK